MKVAFGLKVHSGWAALVVLGSSNGEISIVDRRRLELVEEEWAKQPYHAAEHLKPDAARGVVARGIQAAQRIATREVRAAVKRAMEAGHEVAVCAVLVSDPMPEWSVEEILAVHFRMHKAEGVLFKEALARAAEAAGLKLAAIPEKLLDQQAAGARKRIETLGKAAGPPWGKDQKDAALAALIAVEEQC